MAERPGSVIARHRVLGIALVIAAVACLSLGELTPWLTAQFGERTEVRAALWLVLCSCAPFVVSPLLGLWGFRHLETAAWLSGRVEHRKGPPS